MEDSIVSIIVPVYNNERYIGKCLDTLIKQTYRNLEILVINDGSSDKSLEIIEKYRKIDQRIRVYTQCNSGQSIARNYALSIAKGKYIAFCDSDDTVENTYIEKMVKNSTKLDVDILTCGYKEVYRYGQIDLNDFFFGGKIIEKREFIQSMFKGVGGSLWGKLFKHDIILKNNIKMNPNIYMCEDMVFILEYAMYCNRFGAIGDILYNYNRFNEDSISLNISLNHYNNITLAMEEVERILVKNNYDKKLIDSILKKRIESMTIEFLITQHDKKYEYSKVDKEKNIETIINNKFLRRYKNEIKSPKKIDMILFYFIKKDKKNFLNLYSNILYQVKCVKDKIKRRV